MKRFPPDTGRLKAIETDYLPWARRRVEETFKGWPNYNGMACILNDLADMVAEVKRQRKEIERLNKRLEKARGR